MSRTTSDSMRTVVQSVCEQVNTPRALSVWLCFQHNQEALVDLPLPDVAVSDSTKFALDYFVTEYLSKYKGLKLSRNLRQVALEKWRLSEVQCKATNSRVREWKLRPLTGRAASILFDTQRKIASVLGRLNLPIVLDSCKWGPGATFDLRRSDAALDKKISGALSVTAESLPFLRAVIQSDPHWVACFTGVIPDGPCSLLSNCFRVVRGSRFLTVPKNAKTDRCIAAEPTGNSFLQQGVHQYMRRRLRRFGVDLDDQSINQRRARYAYSSKLSTLDLSAASDTISTQLVFDLLPIDWALFLDSLRSKETYLDGEWVRTEKFASMGNAFCFELETLIFWALASSVSEFLGLDDRPTVYGDDIVCHRDAFDLLVEMLEICGFTVNRKKSFKDGNFFESCGKHYHKGVDVTPVYQKELLNTPSEVIRAHNRLVRFASRVTPELGPFGTFPGALRKLCNAYQLRPFPRIPFGCVEDGGFLRPLSEFIRDPNHGFRCHVLDFVPSYEGVREDAVYAYKLRRFVSRNPLKTGHAGRTALGRWRTKVRWIPYVETVESPRSLLVEGIWAIHRLFVERPQTSSQELELRPMLWRKLLKATAPHMT